MVLIQVSPELDFAAFLRPSSRVPNQHRPLKNTHDLSELERRSSLIYVRVKKSDQFFALLQAARQGDRVATEVLLLAGVGLILHHLVKFAPDLPHSKSFDQKGQPLSKQIVYLNTAQLADLLQDSLLRLLHILTTHDQRITQAIAAWTFNTMCKKASMVEVAHSKGLSGDYYALTRMLILENKATSYYKRHGYYPTREFLTIYAQKWRDRLDKKHAAPDLRKPGRHRLDDFAIQKYLDLIDNLNAPAAPPRQPRAAPVSEATDTEKLDRAIRDLTPAEQTMIGLLRRGLYLTQIAASLDEPVGTVKSRYRCALKTLRTNPVLSR